MQINRVFVNSYRAVCSAALNAEDLFKVVCTQKSGIKTSTTFYADKTVGIGIVKVDLEKSLLEEIGTVLKNSNLDNFEETLLVIGSSVGGMRLSEEKYFQDNSYKNINPALHVIDSISYKISQKYTFKDDLSFSTACTSSANALGYAYEVISKGVYKNVLVVGYDTLCKTTVGGFYALGVLSANRCKPFDKNRDGMNVAEGLGILLLQNKQIDTSVEFCGVGYSSDAFHMTQPNPEGAKKAMQNALTCKGLQPEDISYINAHGTGTKANDSSEISAIESLFGKSVPVSSTKSITGHTLGAAGALEAILSVVSLQKQIIMPNSNLEYPEAEGMNYVLKAEEKEINYILSNSFAFGGNNTSLLFGTIK
ncbi:beta-ketoacyl-[acyl-carrier-protein] synthase family protein [Sulfurospirillum arcachonense]|uniref:beta-ketoacyl-[acyl-carrier-protein] synthase family protein n=1 Tax=Sulfurospirillum arcachonense TaxID=57666 RepID=UPI000468F617|nr:beta-ketoacyl-[acyl-carrier-protein] synthase family protein [Sulfurospirillum arcachonense]